MNVHLIGQKLVDSIAVVIAVMIGTFINASDAQALNTVAPVERNELAYSSVNKISLLIEPAELEGQLQRERLRIIDTRSMDRYEQGHIPGAVRVDVASWKELGTTKGGFQNAKAWGQKVRRLGINADSEIVVYGDGLTSTARIWWTLKYLGLKEVKILNGGWNVWVNEKRPSSSVLPRVTSTKFVPQFQADRLEEIDSLKKSLRTSKVTIVDTRSEGEYTGRVVRGKRGGHIPGATHLEWKEVLAADGRFKPVAELQKLFRERGILPEETVVSYCQSGARASVEAFALELVGYPQVKLFVRSWEQWSADPEAPVEKGN